MTNQYDITIVGAGPAGAFSALCLAKLGIPSLLIEKEKFPRDKVCGDALSGKVVEVMKKINPEWIENFSKTEVQVGSYGVKFVAPNGKFIDIPFKKSVGGKNNGISPGFIAKRIDFDNYLIELVRKESLITLWENCSVTDITDLLDVKCQRNGSVENFQTKVLVGADGAHSVVAKKLAHHTMEKKYHCAGIRAYYRGVRDIHTENFIELYFLKETLPGYFWIFPLTNGMANVGIGIRSDAVSRRRINLNTLLFEITEKNAFIKKRFEGAELVGGVRGWGLPLGSKKRNLSGEKFLLLGDAASLIDPFTGEGIGNAMVSAKIAAEHLKGCLEQNNFSASQMKKYDDAVYQKLWSELKLSYRIQQLIEFPRLFNFVVNKASRNKTLRETISCMFEDLDLRAKLRNPMFYLKLIFNN